MAAKKTAAHDGDEKLHRLDRFGHRHEISEKDVAPDPQPALPAAQDD